MNLALDPKLGLQPDLYQRYAFLSGLLAALGGGAEKKCRVLDLGCGPARLTEQFAPTWCELVRADVDTFDDPEIVRLQPGKPLPFTDLSFDLVLALDVLEHVEAPDRAALVAECQRVARRAVILSAPAGTPEVERAEQAFAAFAKKVSGHPLEFLVEHAHFGLPPVRQILEAFDSSVWQTLEIENSPLEEWQLFNAIDFIYSCDLADSPAKQAANALINASSRFRRENDAHYRAFVCGFRTQDDYSAAQRFLDSPTMARAPLSPSELVRISAELFANLRNDLKQNAEEGGRAKDAHIEKLEGALRELNVTKDAHIAKLGQSMDALAKAKDAQIGKIDELLQRAHSELQLSEGRAVELDQKIHRVQRDAAAANATLVEQAGALGSARAQLAEQQAAADALRAEVSQKDDVVAALRELAGKKQEHLASLALELKALQSQAREDRTTISGLEGAVSARQRQLQAERETLERAGGEAVTRLSQQIEALQSELAAMRGSRSWKAMELPRQLNGTLRELRAKVSAKLPGARPRLAPAAPPSLAPMPRVFDREYYLSMNPDVVASGLDPLLHYRQSGAREGRAPHLFDRAFYLQQNPDVAAAGIDPLSHFLQSGGAEGRDPHPLFNRAFYLQQNPDVAASGMDAWEHYVSSGAREGRNPHPLFDRAFYLAQNPDVAAAGMDPLLHYLRAGGLEGRDPHPDFDSSWYLEQNPDVAAARLNPLVHYLTEGAKAGRLTRAPAARVRARGYVPPTGLLPWFSPLNLAVSAELSRAPRLNVLVPGLAMKHMSGGPNTALALAARLAMRGVPIRFISTDAPVDPDPAPFWAHVTRMSGAAQLPGNLQLVDGHDRTRPIHIGANDLFFATAWWTAQQAKYATRLTRQEKFLYLIQDYEPLLHAASTSYALASETYRLPHVPIVNTGLLHEFLAARQIGLFGDSQFSQEALVFEPALDQSIFHPRIAQQTTGRRRLLFYARPTNGLRNLFELGVASLQKAISDGVLDPAEWDFIGMGEQFSPVPLGAGATLNPAPWLGLDGYARQMRESDILLSLMLSPHPSYPPLEMAASAGLAVTTAFENKSAARLARISRNIIAVEPTLEGLCSGLSAAVSRVADWDARRESSGLALPNDWDAAFEPILAPLLDQLALLQGSPSMPRIPGLEDLDGSRVFPGFRSWPKDDYELYRREALQRRRARCTSNHPGLVSLVSPVWNTDPRYLEALAHCVFGQDGGTDFEWIILDNGSEHPGTRECLARLALHPAVRLHRVEKNLGIIGATRFLLEHAQNRYIVPLDSDDLLTPDCVRVLSESLVRAGFPPLAYSDEDKLEGESLRDPYFKPSWDPVLFVNSCFIAHVTAIDRKRALELGAYTDKGTDGSHDWDTFTRFMLAGHVPLHIPAVLYSWRMHPGSTAGNIDSKPYISSSQRNVLAKVLAAHSSPCELVPSPFFSGTPDWWIRRRPERLWPLKTIQLDPSLSLSALQQEATECAARGELVHLVWPEVKIEGSDWACDAMAHFELFPDTVMIGGRVLRGARVLAAGCYFGFEEGCQSPDRGRVAVDPGYFAQMWKAHSVSAVSAHHCVLKAEFLAAALVPLVDGGISLAYLGAWLGAAARTAGSRVVYSPFFTASSEVDLDAAVSAVEKAAFRAVHRNLLPENQLLSPALGLRRSTAYRPVAPSERLEELETAAPPQPYRDWLLAQEIARAIRYPLVPGSPTFSLLTTVYSGTPPEAFRQTAKSLFEQTQPFAQWVLLLHGPIAPEIKQIVAELERDERVRVLRRDENVGIIRGLALCLKEATADYVIPMDADDLLTRDALQTFAASAHRSGPDLLYSDEDTLREGEPVSPYFRPDFDRVLNAESSYVWHLCAFRREQALRLGVYGDTGAEFCHDWDTLCRFAGGGKKILHVPEVLYHWRAHATSQSNSAVQNPGSAASTRFVLERTRSALPSPERYRLAPFPIFRGAEEWFIERLPIDPPRVQVLAFGKDVKRTLSAFRSSGFPFSALSSVGEDPLTALREVADSEAELVVVTDPCASLSGPGVWEAIKLFELHPEVAIVSGRCVDAHDEVVAAGGIQDRQARAVFPHVGQRRDDPGPFGLALKPHCIVFPARGLFVVRAPILKAALAQLPAGFAVADLSTWLAAFAIARNKSVAHSPLLEAKVRQSQSPERAEDPAATLRSFLTQLGVAPASLRERRLGAAGLLAARADIATR